MRRANHAAYHHTATRARERYGVDLTRADYAALIRLIQRQCGVFIWSASRSRSIWRLIWQDQPLLVVYSRSTKVIVTCLPAEWLPLEPPTLADVLEAADDHAL